MLAPDERSVLPANKVVPQKLYFLSLFPSGNKDFFISERRKAYDEEATGKTMVRPQCGLTMRAQVSVVDTPLGTARYRSIFPKLKNAYRLQSAKGVNLAPPLGKLARREP